MIFFAICNYQKYLTLTGIMGPMMAPTLKLGIALLSGGNVAVQQVEQFTMFSSPAFHQLVFFLTFEKKY